MDETILFPSPNWFQPSGIAVSTDEWLVYGGPTKSLCVLEPLPPENDTVIKGQQAYTAHVVNRAHPEKIVCVDLCPEWPEKRCALTGSSDGAVKQWSFEKTQNSLKIKSTHSHEMHSHEKEEVIGVGYCKDGYAVTVGCFGHIVKWDLNSNVAKSFNHVLKNFKPVCMACSPHLHMHVAIGTKQGVLFVLDLNGYPRIIYKVRGQDDEIIKVSWCPQYEVAVRKALKEIENKRSTATQRLEKIRKEPEAPETLKLLDERVKNSQTSEKPVKINENSEPVTEATPSQETLDESGIGKTLPEDSFDESAVQEDDMFDIYKDHEADEFGHKKFQPVDIMVKVPTETVKEDYLVDCLKLKEEILKRKAQSDTTIGELVEAMDKTQLDAQPEEQASTYKPDPPVEGKITKVEMESSVHIHKHLLATISKHGSIRVWSKSGKLVGSCAVLCKEGGKGKGGGGKRGNVSTLVWATPEILLLGDGNNQILDCNPLKIDCKNKLQWKPIHHLHSRGLFAVAVNTPRVQTPSCRHEDVAIWSAAQDRGLVRYSLKTKEAVTHMTCGGYIYTIKPCPYDARRVSISVGDGNIRVWEADSLEEDESKLSTSRILNYWQNVMGKVLATAWHPSKENLLAFSTAESRVGIIDCVGKEKPAKVLQPVIAGGIYSLCWTRDTLLACGNGHVAQYQADNLDQAPVLLNVSLEGARWEVSAVHYHPQYMAVGSNAGAVGIVTHDFNMIAACFVFNKMIHTIDWHPQETTLSSEPSQYNNLIAVCSLAKVNTVIIMEFADEKDGPADLSVWKTLSGHSDTVLQVMWSPHRDQQLLSTSQDGTVRIWDVTEGVCTHIFGGHVTSAIGASWCAWPSLPDHVLSGGGDSALRLWDINKHPADTFRAIKYDVSVDKKNKKKDQRREREEKKNQERREEEQGGGDAGVGGAGAGGAARGYQDAVADDRPKRRHNKKFLLPILDKQMQNCSVAAPRKMLQKHLQKNNGAGIVLTTQATDDTGTDFINIFGNINEVNALLDGELERHEDTGGEEAWLVLNILRGNIDACVQRAARRDAIDLFLLTIAPAVSFKYWKDVTLMYLQQMERLAAKGEEYNLLELPTYGGPVFRRVCALLSLHDVRGAVHALQDARLYKEAYLLSRTRYMDSLAEGTLRLWAQFNLVSCQWNLSAVCYIALGDLAAAADALSKSFEEGSLSLAADIAKTLGQHTFATHVEGKRDQLKHMREQEHQAINQLQPLPNRMDAILKRALEETDDDTSEASVSVQEDVKEDEAKVVTGEEKEVKDETKEMIDEAMETKDETKEAKDVDEEKAVKDETEDTKDETIETKDETKEVKDEMKDVKDGTKEIKDEAKEMEDESKDLKDNAKEIKDEAKSLKDTAKELEVLKNVSDDDKVINKTEELLEKLPEKMEGLMKEPSKVGANAGNGDTVQNGHTDN